MIIMRIFLVIHEKFCSFRDLREEFFATEKLTSSYLEILFDNLKLSGNLGSESGTSDSLVKTAFVGLNELIRLAVKIRKENKISR